MKRTVGMLLLAVAASLSSACLHAQVVVIVNPAVSTSTALKKDVREIFSGSSSTLRDGSRVTPILLKAGPTEDEFVATYVGKSDGAFRAAWRSLVFSGQAGMPKSLDTEAAVVDYVTRNPGAIGYIRPGTPHDGVKVLSIR